jgi:hypothetical protein
MGGVAPFIGGEFGKEGLDLGLDALHGKEALLCLLQRFRNGRAR